MKATDEKCCVCGEPATECALDGTGWCQIHLADWNAFHSFVRDQFDSLEATFQAWLKQARDNLAAGR